MTYTERILETAREIIRQCEEFQQGNDSDFSKAEEQRTAYRELKELLTAESEGAESEEQA
jgi:hypothetical protein